MKPETKWLVGIIAIYTVILIATACADKTVRTLRALGKWR